MTETYADGTARETDRLIPMRVGQHRILLAVRDGGTGGAAGYGEREISSREPKLEQVLDGVAAFAEELVERMKGTEASKLTVEFGCDIKIESGSLFAVIGKASASSSVRIGLEWVKPSP